jgi:hypothetical protein
MNQQHELYALDSHSESNSLLSPYPLLKAQNSNATYPPASPYPLDQTINVSISTEKDALAEQITKTNA